MNKPIALLAIIIATATGCTNQNHEAKSSTTAPTGVIEFKCNTNPYASTNTQVKYFLDGKCIAITTSNEKMQVEVPAGAHEVAIEVEGKVVTQSSITVLPALRHPVTASLLSTSA